MKLSTYIIFSAMNIFIYCIPASWVWNETGFLRSMGFYDFAGGGVVHLTGGCSALVGALIVGPRLGRFPRNGREEDPTLQMMSSPVTALTGMCMLWWAWLSFNCGSTFGVRGDLWKLATKVAVTTVNGSIGGSMAALLISVIHSRKHLFVNVSHLIKSLLGGLVAVTAGCSVIGPAESLLISFIGGLVAIGVKLILERVQIDDPVGAVPVHLFTGLWGILAVGLFRRNDHNWSDNQWTGVLYGGKFENLGVQALGALLLAAWSITATSFVFALMKYTIGVRMDEKDEVLGADWVEHQIQSEESALRLEKKVTVMRTANAVEQDLAAKILDELKSVGRKSIFADPGIIHFSGAKGVPEELVVGENSNAPSFSDSAAPGPSLKTRKNKNKRGKVSFLAKRRVGVKTGLRVESLEGSQTLS